MLTRPPVSRGLAVSLPPSCAKVFDAIGVRDVIEHAGFLRSSGNTVWWGSADARVEGFARGEQGWQVDVDALANVLLTEAISAGVIVEHATITDVPEGFVLDCTGRSGVVARAMKVREFDEGPRTVALVGVWWHDGGWPVPDDTHTLIESYADGWMWSVPSAPGLRHIAAMVDPQRSDLARGEPSSTIYAAEIRKTRTFAELIKGASMIEGPRGFDASQYRARDYAGDRWLLVGDAGSFVDPLSSAGVKKSLASAWLASIATHTAIKNPVMRAHAFDFFSAREHEIERHLSKESRRYLSAAAADHTRPFWDERSDQDTDEPPDSEQVRRAFEALKSRDTWQPRRAAGASIDLRPCIREHEIVLDPHVVSPAAPRGVRYVRSIDMVAVMELAPGTRQVPELYERYVQRLGPVPLPDFLYALATAAAHGWLVSE